MGPEVKGAVGSTRQTQCPRHHAPACVLRAHTFRGWHVLGWICWGVGKCGSQEAGWGLSWEGRDSPLWPHGRGETLSFPSLATSASPRSPHCAGQSGGPVVCCLDTGGALGEQQGGKDGKRGAQSPPFVRGWGLPPVLPLPCRAALSAPGPLTALAPTPELGCSE